MLRGPEAKADRAGEDQQKFTLPTDDCAGEDQQQSTVMPYYAGKLNY
jgi:hypothetical protein